MNSIHLKKPLILASGSPRRRELMTTLGLPFQVLVSDVNESFPPQIPVRQVPAYLAEIKAEAVLSLKPDALILAADTVVVLGNEILNKPMNMEEARKMLRQLSGKIHEVHTAFCLMESGFKVTKTDLALVKFKDLSDWEIDFYIQAGKPLDKAGAYGIQEWIGLIAVEQMEGSYFTVMGLPTHLVWQELGRRV